MLRALVTITRRNLLTTLGKIPRNYSSGKKASDKVPSKPVWELVQSLDLEERTNFNPDLIHNLERLSLVEFGNREGLARLCAAIDLADQLQLVDTEGVEPMDSLHEDIEACMNYLRRKLRMDSSCHPAFAIGQTVDTAVDILAMGVFLAMFKSVSLAMFKGVSLKLNDRHTLRVLTTRRVYLRQDVADEGNCRGEVMRNAQVTFEEYFVAPPGNIALTKSSNYDD